MCPLVCSPQQRSKTVAVPIYNSTSVLDDMAWAGVWLHIATSEEHYLGQSQRYIARHYRQVRVCRGATCCPAPPSTLLPGASLAPLTPSHQQASTTRPAQSTSATGKNNPHTSLNSRLVLPQDLDEESLKRDRSYYVTNWNNVAWATNVLLAELTDGKVGGYQGLRVCSVAFVSWCAHDQRSGEWQLRPLPSAHTPHTRPPIPPCRSTTTAS